MGMIVEFTDSIELARFCAELVRQGVTFYVEQADGYWVVNFTGGF